MSISHIFIEIEDYIDSKFSSDHDLCDIVQVTKNRCNEEVYHLENQIDDLEYDLEKRQADINVEDESDNVKSLAEDIVQKHRCGEDWQQDGLKLLYDLANKVV